MSIFILGLIVGQAIAITVTPLVRPGRDGIETIGLTCVAWAAIYLVIMMASAVRSASYDERSLAPLLAFVLAIINITLAYVIHRGLERLVRKPR